MKLDLPNKTRSRELKFDESLKFRYNLKFP